MLTVSANRALALCAFIALSVDSAMQQPLSICAIRVRRAMPVPVDNVDGAQHMHLAGVQGIPSPLEE